MRRAMGGEAYPATHGGSAARVCSRLCGGDGEADQALRSRPDDEPAKSCDVFLVDGNGLAYRAFYALPEELQTADGQPTNALLGMANMLMRLLIDYRPPTVLVAWDERPTERLELDPEYKAHRKPTPAAAAGPAALLRAAGRGLRLPQHARRREWRPTT